MLEVKALRSPLLNCKSLTLDMADGDLPGIAKLLNNSPYLEMLVISTETVSPSEVCFPRTIVPLSLLPIYS